MISFQLLILMALVVVAPFGCSAHVDKVNRDHECRQCRDRSMGDIESYIECMYSLQNRGGDSVLSSPLPPHFEVVGKECFAGMNARRQQTPLNESLFVGLALKQVFNSSAQSFDIFNLLVCNDDNCKLGGLVVESAPLSRGMYWFDFSTIDLSMLGTSALFKLYQVGAYCQQLTDDFELYKPMCKISGGGNVSLSFVIGGFQGAVDHRHPLPVCTEAAAGVFVPLPFPANEKSQHCGSLCFDNGNNVSELLGFESAYHHILAPRHCRYELYNRKQFQSCMKSNKTLFIGDSVVHGLYTAMKFLDVKETPSLCTDYTLNDNLMRSGNARLPGPTINYIQNHIPFRYGLYGWLKRINSYTDVVLSHDVVIMGSFMHDFSEFKQKAEYEKNKWKQYPIKMYRANMDQLGIWLDKIHEQKPLLRIIWILGTRSMADPADMRYTQQAVGMTQAAATIVRKSFENRSYMEIFDAFQPTFASHANWYYNPAHFHKCGVCIGPQKNNTCPPFGGGLNKMLAQVLIGQLCN